LQYLAGYIGTSEVQKRIVDAGLRIGAIAYWFFVSCVINFCLQ
jgi:hypothetical protein